MLVYQRVLHLLSFPQNETSRSLFPPSGLQRRATWKLSSVWSKKERQDTRTCWKKAHVFSSKLSKPYVAYKKEMHNVCVCVKLYV